MSSGELAEIFIGQSSSPVPSPDQASPEMDKRAALPSVVSIGSVMSAR